MKKNPSRKKSPKTPSSLIIILLAGLLIVIGLIWFITRTSANNNKPSALALSSNNPQKTAGQSESMVQPSVEIGKPAPDFLLKSIDGKEIRLSDFAGKPVMINFWATWCPPCQKEMPEIKKFYEKYNASGLVVLSINSTFQDTIDNVKETVKMDQLTFPILLDETGQVEQLYHLNGLPTSYFIDNQGILRKIQIGEINPSDLDGYFSEMTLHE